jgi:hypothetical protein
LPFSARSQGPLWQNPFTGRSLPKAVWALWWITFAAFLAVIAWKIFLIGGSEVQLPWFFRFSAGLALIATLVVKFKLFEQWISGATFVFVASAISLSTFAFGTAPSRDFLVVEEIRARNVSRLFLGWLLALLVEINTEVTPAGDWVIRQFEPTDIDRRADNMSLIHSAYVDPRVIDQLVLWIAASTGCAMVNGSRDLSS